MKEKYISPLLDIIDLEDTDVIVTSSTPDNLNGTVDIDPDQADRDW